MSRNEARRRITADLRAIGLCPGGVVLVHSSLSSLGWIPGGGETVIEGLTDALGPEGTLLMPALSYEHAGPHSPEFDIRQTPSNVGKIPEHFRKRPGTIRSVNPTHSVCGIGPMAESLLADHQVDETPCGAHSPYRALRDAGGTILFLGCGLCPNTSIHAIEEVIGPEYLFGPMVEYRVTLADGSETRMRNRSHSFRGWAQRYDRLAALLHGDALRAGRVLAAVTHVVDAGPMWERALEEMRRDPLHFVDRIESAAAPAHFGGQSARG